MDLESLKHHNYLNADILKGFDNYKVSCVKQKRFLATCQSSSEQERRNILNENLSFLQYNAKDTSPLSVYVMHPFWNWIVQVRIFEKQTYWTSI